VQLAHWSTFAGTNLLITMTLKTLVLFFLALCTYNAYAQDEVTSAPEDEAQLFKFLKLDGEFSFQLHGSDYNLNVNRSEGTFVIQNSNGSINSSGTIIQINDVLYILQPSISDSNSLINSEVTAELSDRGTDRLYFSVTREGESAVQLELIKSE
jgi:hypothetical protein